MVRPEDGAGQVHVGGHPGGLGQHLSATAVHDVHTDSEGGLRRWGGGESAGPEEGADTGTARNTGHPNSLHARRPMFACIRALLTGGGLLQGHGSSSA